MRKRFLSIALVVCMVLTMLPTAAVTAKAANYDATYTGTLTAIPTLYSGTVLLDGCTINSSTQAIIIDGNVTLVIKGTVSLNAGTSYAGIQVLSGRSVTILGYEGTTNTLIVRGGNAYNGENGKAGQPGSSSGGGYGGVGGIGGYGGGAAIGSNGGRSNAVYNVCYPGDAIGTVNIDSSNLALDLQGGAGGYGGTGGGGGGTSDAGKSGGGGSGGGGGGFPGPAIGQGGANGMCGGDGGNGASTSGSWGAVSGGGGGAAGYGYRYGGGGNGGRGCCYNWSAINTAQSGYYSNVVSAGSSGLPSSKNESSLRAYIDDGCYAYPGQGGSAILSSGMICGGEGGLSADKIGGSGASIYPNSVTTTSYKTICFDANGGSVNSYSMSAGWTVGNLPSSNPTREGYTFQGWNTSSDGTGYTVTTATTLSSTANTYYAVWKRNTYNATITVRKNGEVWTDVASDMVVLSTSSDSVQTGKMTATQSNGVFTFSGIEPAATPYIWAKNKAGVYVRQGYVSVSNTVFSVYYYGVTLTAGIGIDSVSGAGTYLGGETATVSAVLRQGYTWGKWSDNNTTMTGRTITVTAKADLTANAAADPATVPAINSTTGATLDYGYESGSIRVSATAADPNHVLSYQWYEKITTGDTQLTGATGSSYSIPTGKGAGTYQYYCVVTATRADNGQAASATTSPLTEVTVNKINPTENEFSYTLPTDLVYTGSAQGVSVTAKDGVTGLGAITVYYQTKNSDDTYGEKAATAPADAGAYRVIASVADGQNYNDHDVTLGEYTIAKKTPEAADFNFSLSARDYTGSESAVTVAAKYAGMGTIGVFYAGMVPTAYTKSATPPTMPGTYTVTVDVTEGGNYTEVTGLDLGTVTINQATPAITLTSSKAASVYEDEVTFTAAVSFTGGAMPTGTVTFKNGGTVLSTVSLDGDGKAVLTKSDLTANTHTITAVYSGDSIYRTKTSAELSQTVAQKPVKFTVSGTDQTYESGVERKISITGTDSKLSDADFTVKYYRVEENEDVLASVTPVTKTISSGKYLYVIDFKNTSDYTNYGITREYTVGGTAMPNVANYDNAGYLLIKAAASGQKPISFQSGFVSKYVTDAAFTNALTNDNGTTATYSSSNQSVATVAVDGTVTIKAAGSTTITATSQKDGTAPVYASYTLTVSKESITVTVQDKTVEYGAAMPYADVAALSFSKSISAADYDTAGLTFSDYTQGRGVGECTITANGLSSDKYSFTYIPGTLTVEPKTLTADNFSATAQDKYYDGAKAASATVTVENVSDALGVQYGADFADASAGNSKAVTITVTGLTGVKSTNYVLANGSITLTAAADIDAMPIRFTFGATTFGYDGTAKPVSVSASDLNGKVFSDFTVEYDGDTAAPSNVGEYTVTAALSDASNYTSSTTSATLTINPGTAVVWAAGNTSHKYDGTAKTITAMSAPTVNTKVTYYKIADSKVGDEIAAPTDKGDYLYVITLHNEPNYVIKNAVTVASGDAVSSLTGTNFGTMEIAESVQPDLSFTELLLQKSYGDDPFTVSVAGGAEGAGISYVSSDSNVLSVDNNGLVTVVKPGLATITATAHKEGFGDVKATCAVQVSKKTVTLSLRNNTTLTYNSAAQTAPFDVSDGLLASDIDFTYTSIANPNLHTPKNADTYQVTVRVKGDNEYYRSELAVGLLKITPAPLTVTANDKTITYGDAPTSNGVTCSPLLGTDVLSGTLSFTYGYEQYGDVGNYQIIPSGLSSNNYTINFVPGTLTVNARPVTLLWGTPLSLPYNGAEQSVTATVCNAVNNDIVSVTAYMGNTEKNKGNYTAEAKSLSNTNYTLDGGSPLTQAWEITAATPTLSLSNKSAAYTGSAIEIGTAKIIGVGADGDITASCIVTYTYCTDTACITMTSTADGAARDGEAPSMDGTYYVKASIPASGNYTAAEMTATLTIYTPYHSGGGGGPANGGGPVNVGETVYPITEGADGEWTQGENNSLFFRSAGPYSSFLSVSVDNSTIRWNEDYTVAEGSTIVTLKPEYLATLAVGTHILRITFTGGYSVTTFTIGEKTAWVNPFTDVTESDWFFEDVRYVHESGLMQGIGDRMFSPYLTTTRGMIVAILWRLEGEPEATAAMAFTDVPMGMYYHDAVEWAAENKIVEGYDTLTFGPDNPITREQMAAILYRYAVYKGYDVTATAVLSMFTDADKIGSWATAAMSWANANGFINGKGGGILDPGGEAERCQVAAILRRFYNEFVK